MIFHGTMLMSRVCLMGRSRLPYYTQAQSKTVDSFRLLLPAVMKEIHPDLYVAEDKEVRVANAECTKILMGLWRELEELERKVNDMQRHTLLLPPALEKRYVLKCFSRNTMATGDDATELVVVNCVVEVPPDLHRRAPLAQKKAIRHVASICRQLDPFLRKLGIEDPFKDFKLGGSGEVIHAGSGQNSKARKGRKDNGGFMGIGDTPLEEVGTLMRQAGLRAAELNALEELELHNSFGLVTSRKGRKGTKKDYLGLVHDVKRFLGSGNVVVKNLSTVEEVKVLQRLETFLIENGSIMHFSIDEWWRAIFVLDGMATTFSVSQEKGKRIIIKFPAQFKHGSLIRFVRDHVLDKF